MTRSRLAWLALVALVATAASATAARGAGGLGIAQARATFPERALVLTLPTRVALDPQHVRVLENGLPVDGLSLVPAERAAAQSFGVVLALDASNSMRGAPVTAALAAARAFAAERAPATELGLVTFNSDTNTVLEPTTDAAAIESALARRPLLSEGTRMRDAVAQAIALVTRSRVRAGSVVVLSDGADIGSRTSAEALVRRARAAGVRVFTVGLRSAQFAPDALRTLAEGTGGRYAEAADSARLAPLYRALGRELASEYLVRYHSTAAAGARVHVTVQVSGFADAATLAYRTPGMAEAVFNHSWQDRFWRSNAGIAAVAGLVAFLAAAAMLLGLRSVRRSVGSRVAAYSRPEVRKRRRKETLLDRLTLALERSFGHIRGWQAFAEEVEIAQFRVPAATLAAAAAAGALLLGPVAAVLAHTPLLLVLGLVPPVAVRLLVKHRLGRLRRRFEDELPDNLQVIASAMRAGHGLSGALGVVAADTTEPARSEFERALADERLGVPLEDALSTVAERMASDDLEQVALVAALHRETGGNTAEVLDRVHDSIRERGELRRMIRSLTAEGRMTRWILTALPIVLAAAIALLNGSYLQPLLDTNGGRALLALATVMVITGSLVIKKIIEIEV
ncbi:MAG TPA: type II secretion system F family protein [Gaiellaceae bacterium]|nr:type II secretion system F family protein [Gaiellaceae bacterium]